MGLARGMEPGKEPLARLTISMREQDELKLRELRAALEAKLGRNFTVSSVIREALSCLAEREGVK